MKIKVLLLLLGLALCASCQSLLQDGSPCPLTLSFGHGQFLSTRAALGAVPDTNEFLLTVTDSKGSPIYSGKYGASPETMMVQPGSYTVDIRSCEFSAPAFDSPQYGDTQVVMVEQGRACHVTLQCSQVNSGVKLNIASDFLTSYPQGVLSLTSDQGRLIYTYREDRIAYFQPGKVSLVMSDGFSEKVLMTRTLSACEILCVSVSAPARNSSWNGPSVSVKVDTTRNWTHENFTIGGNDGRGNTIDTALSVAQARSNTGAADVWVYGYIVAGDLTSASAKFKGPFTSKTNIALGSKSSVTTRESILSVQLSKGATRDALNLVDNPSLLGKKVFVKGDIVPAYYGLPGVVNISEYKL